MRKIVLLTILGVALVGAIGGGAWWWSIGRFFETTDDAYTQSDITVVAPKVEGYIREVRVQQNQTVKAGEVLAVIEDRDYVARFDQATAAFETEKATLGTVESKIAWQRSMIDQAAAMVASAEADQKRAVMDYERYRNLMQGDYASRQRYETADADARKAEAAVARSRAALGAERSQLGVVEAQRIEQAARVKQSAAQLVLARNNLDDTIIRAAVSGVVGNKAVQVGQYVKVGTQLVSLVPLPEIYVTANFKETQLAHMRPGQPVDIAVDAYPGIRIRGRVESFSPASGAQFSLLPPENATGNFTKVVQRVPVRIAVPTDGELAGLLRPGLSVIASVDTRSETRHGGGLARLFDGALGAAAAEPK